MRHFFKQPPSHDPVLGELNFVASTEQWTARQVFRPVDKEVEITFTASKAGPAQEHRDAFQAIEKRYHEFEPSIAERLLAYHLACQADGMGEELPDFRTDLKEPADIWRVAELAYIYLEGLGAFSLVYTLQWDHEHDYTFRIEDWKLDDGFEM